MRKLTTTIFALFMAAVSAKAMVYMDAANDTPTSSMDILQVEVTHDSANLDFVITLASTGLETDEWARFALGIDSVVGGSTTADAWNDKIIMSSGMDFWGGGWTVSGTNSAGFNIYDAALDGWPEWENGGDGSTWVGFTNPVFSGNTISFSVPLVTLGLSAGDSFNFDIYTFWNDSSPSDALGISTLIPSAQYDSGSNISTYTLEGGEPIYGDPAEAIISIDGTNAVVEFLAENNVSYYMQSTSNLTQSWSNVSALIVGDGTTNSTSYPASSPAQFFRVIQP